MELDDPNETDIDGEDRIIDGDEDGTAVVDMGADEYYWSRADFNGDEIVNFLDYALFAGNWQKTDDANDYYDVYDLEDNNSIDYNDLRVFCEDWLWEAGWTKAFSCGMGMGMGRGSWLSEGLLSYGAAKESQSEVDQGDIEEILKWLEELWLTNEELRKLIPEDEWLKFIEAIESWIQ